MANVITNYIWKIPNIEFTHGFMNSGALDSYGEALFQTYKDNTDPIPVTVAGITVNKVIFKASSANTFYIGAYRSSLSDWTERGRVDTFFSVFYKHPSGAISGEPYIDITFPGGYIGSTAGTKGDLTVRRTVYRGCFWKPDTETSDIFSNKYIPILSYHSINRRVHSYPGDAAATSKLGWVYSYYVGTTNSVQETLVPEQIITGGTSFIFGARVKTTFTVTGAVEDDTIPIFVLDMNNGQRKANSGGSGTGGYHYSADDFTAGKWSEGCVVPSNTAVEVSDGKRFYAGNSLASSVPTSTGVDGTYNKNMAFVQSYNYSSGSVSGTQFCGVAGIQKASNYSGWPDDEYSMGCGIAFFMSATGANRSFYPMGSWGITQLFPALSAKERTIEFYGQTDSQKVTGKVYVGDPYGSNSYGWPIEGDDEPTWIKRTGHKLVGWSTSRTSETLVSDKTKVPDGTAPIKLYAKWTPINYTLSLKANATPASAGNENYAVVSPSTMPADKSVAYGTTLASSYLPTPTATSHTFVRWNTKADNSGTTYNTSSTMPASNLTLYAIWKLKEYTVTYKKTDGTNGTDTFKYGDSITINKDGGTGGTDSFTIKSNTSLDAPAKTGYTFGGWSHTTGSKTFKATWIAIDYTATFNPGGGKWSDNTTTNKTSSYNITQTLVAPATVSKEGHTFTGWKVSTAGGNWVSNTVYNNSPQTKLEGSSGKYGVVTFTAQWNKNSYTLTTQIASTSAAMGTVSGGGSKEYDSSCTIIATPEPGYQFVKWVFTGAKTGEITTASTTFNMPAGNVIATAHFEALTYTLSFNLNEGRGCPSDDPQVDPENIPSTPTNRSVVFNGNYAGFNPSTGAAYTTLPGSGSGSDNWDEYFDTWKWNYEFLGWFTTATGTIEKTPTSPYDIAGNSTLYAHWQKTQKQYDVTWKDYDGTVLKGPERLDAGTIIANHNPPDPIRAGYSFTGWKKQGDYPWDEIRSDIVLIAEYTPIVYAIDYILKGGTNNSDNPSTFTVESSTITFKQPNKKGFTFIKWTSDEAGNNTITNIPAGTVLPEGTTVFKVYAWWKVELQPFDPVPGEDSSSNDDFGIPLEDLDNYAKYKLTLSVEGDRKVTNGKSPFTLPTNQGEWLTSTPFSWVNEIKVNGQSVLTADQLRSVLNNNIVFPMDVWRCRIYNPTAKLKVTLVTVYPTIEESSSTDNNMFRISDINKPQLSSVEYDEGVTTIKNLSLSGTDKRFIGNKKSCVLSKVISTNYQGTNTEMLYEAVPAKYIVKLDRGSANTSRSDANWSSGEVIKEMTASQIDGMIAQYTGPSKKKLTYNSGWIEVSGGPSSLGGPFPSIATDLENARLRIRIVDTRHTS